MMRSFANAHGLFHSARRRMAAGVVLELGAIAIWLIPHNSGAQPAVTHGLTGSYYVSDMAVDPDLQLPKPARAPEATRVDAQVAFGQGMGFRSGVDEAGLGAWADQPALKGGRRLGWLKAVLWRGFIHLPKAGTYYFTTVSSGSSAVYLNEARVALNGPASVYGALINSDGFGYDNADIQDFVANVRGTPFYKRVEDAYVVPVTVSGARDLPIQVQYAASGVGVMGIDLMWVTPDSPKDANGKPIAKIVPADALYTAAPGAIEPAVVHSASSMISADHYCAGTKDPPLTLTFRLADKSGRPVAGKRVYFNTLDDEKFGYDVITQPDKPTDENGVTTAQLKSDPNARGHASAIYATDVTDFVDIGQVGHVRFPIVQENFFASPCTAGFDPNLIRVEPLPMVAGRPLTLTVKLENRQKSNVELTAMFQATDWNIGANTWKDIGQVENIRLKPGESKDVSIRWTPTAEQVHQCFRVQLKGGAKAAERSGQPVLAAAFVPPKLLRVAENNGGGDSGGGSVQRNVGPVASGSDPCQDYYNDIYPPEDYPPAGPLDDIQTDIAGPDFEGEANLERKWADRQSNPQRKREAEHIADCLQRLAADPSGIVGTPSDDAKANATALAKRNRDGQAFSRQQMANCPPGDANCVASWMAQQAADGEDAQVYRDIALDPPSASYRGLAVAKADTSPAYGEAVRVSMERYKGAEANGDREWMARHLTAIELYEKRLADALVRDADAFQKKAEALPADDPQKLQAAHDALIAALKRGEPLPADRVNTLRQAGMNDQQIKAVRDDLIAHAGDPVQGPRTGLLQAAARQRIEAKRWQAMADRLARGGQPGHDAPPEMQTFNLINPHDRPEEVHLFVEPMAVPSDWKLSVVNAEQATANGSAAGGAAQPEFPIYEVKPGREYRVSLPPKRQLKLASVVVPVGEVGANTTARWAVEGRIGSEVIGTMVHEMNTPYLVASLQLPPVGSQEQMEDGAPLTSPPSSRLRIALAAAGVAVLALLVLMMWRRKRRAPAV